MSDRPPVYYQPPDVHDQHIGKMLVFLFVFFLGLLLLVAAIILNAHHLAVKLPFAAEKQFIRPYEEFARFLRPQQSAPEEQLIEAYLQGMADDLADKMQVPDDYHISVHLVDVGEVNAFATLGGHIVVFRGLLESMPDENSLAMVLAHEVAHIKHRDPLASVGRGLALQLIYSFISGDYSGGGQLSSLGGEFGLLFFSREQEREADRVALEALYARYGHVAGHTWFFRYVADNVSSDQGEQPAWLSTHPDPSDRVVALEAQAAKNSWPVGESVQVPPEVISAINGLAASRGQQQR